MVTKTTICKNFDGETKTYTNRFHLNKAEMVEMAMGQTGGLDKYVERIRETNDNFAMVQIVKELLLKSYGVKSVDGERFEKSPELLKAFEQSPAYEELFLELAGDADALSTFMTGIVPEEYAAEMKKAAVDSSGESQLRIINPTVE